MNALPKVEKRVVTDASPASDMPEAVMFRRIVAFSTALGLAIALGSEACLEHTPSKGFDFSWHWRAIPAMAIGVAAAIYLWRLLWRAQDHPTPASKLRLMRFCAVLLLLAAGMFLYPISFVSSEHIRDVLIGLSLAATVLTFVGWMIYRVFCAFVENDTHSQEDKPGQGRSKNN